ncbi:MAG: hypothetical protein RLY30_178 [Pseudomonadota bacterium]|jgi:nicotinamide-nucleotide amidase
MNPDSGRLIGLTVGFVAQSAGLRLVLAESCTGGLAASWVTQQAGSSSWFEGGVVSYSNALKHALLGVPEALLLAHGAVSEPVARAMAEGAQARLGGALASVGACAITGIAGPGGGSKEKPVGLVWFAWALPDQPTHSASRVFVGSRQSIQHQAAWFALAQWCGLVTGGPVAGPGAASASEARPMA